MQITFDTTTITDDEVRGIFALLDTVRPAAFDPAEEVTRAVEEKWPSGYSAEVNGQLIPVEEKIAGKGWVAGPSDGNLTFDGEEFPQSPVPPTIDANGLPWDERIHSGTKALNADGTWRTKRGVDKALVASVEAELRHAEVDEPEASDESDPAGRIEAAQSVAVPPAPPAPPAPTAPLAPAVTESAPPTPVAPSSSTSPFVALMKRVTTAQGAGKLTAQGVKELLESLDKKSIMDLRTDTDALDAFAVLLDGEGV